MYNTLHFKGILKQPHNPEKVLHTKVTDSFPEIQTAPESSRYSKTIGAEDQSSIQPTNSYSRRDSPQLWDEFESHF